VPPVRRISKPDESAARSGAFPRTPLQGRLCSDKPVWAGTDRAWSCWSSVQFWPRNPTGLAPQARRPRPTSSPASPPWVCLSTWLANGARHD